MATVSVKDGIASAHLSANEWFSWTNPWNYQVTVSNCSGFCTQDSYVVAANGSTSAQINSNPSSWGFTDTPNTAWAPGGTNPGMPHITNPRQRREEVA
jgi:hypothetical protein